MKTIGLLGGMSWESTVSYYQAVNEGVRSTLGGLHSAKIAMYSVDFAEIEKLQHSGDWEATAEILTKAAKNIEAAGADFLVLCTNTMHKVAPSIEQAIQIPLLHIADATGEALVRQGIQSVALLGTAFTMEQDFYKERLAQKYGLKVLVPNAADRAIVHEVIFEQLCLGEIHRAAKAEYLRIIDSLSSQGAQAVILGCTEIGMLIKQSDTDVILFDTTTIHALRAVDYALKEND
jgi:aspartate racemase